MSSSVISVENLGKRYRIGAAVQRAQDLRQLVGRLVSSPFDYLRMRMRQASEAETLWALKDISFEVSEGEVLGIVGCNGAGKSTLLKVLSRITDPTEGRARIQGRVNSLLEVGTGFHPELTGRENVYLNAAMHGMTRSEVNRKFDEIVAFAEIERFIDTPVKRYSSGMYTRLAFAVAAHLEPDVLIVDEVLAVGDAAFQKKCLGKMGSVAKEGRTVLFVSHNMTAVGALCDRAMWLEKGRIAGYGETHRVVSDYLQQSSTQKLKSVWGHVDSAPGSDTARLHQVVIDPVNRSEQGQITVRSALRFECLFWCLRANAELNISVVVNNYDGTCVFNTASEPSRYGVGLIRAAFTIPANFMNDGSYTVRVLIIQDSSTAALDLTDVVGFEVHDVERSGSWYGKWIGAVRPMFPWTTAVVSTDISGGYSADDAP